MQLAQPHQINPDWKFWRRSALPMLPGAWPLFVDEKRKEQFAVVKRILNDRRVTSVICATDAGREGELIFRQIYEASGSTKPVKRLWISSLTPAAIRQGFSKLRPAIDFDSLAAAARARSRADWLVGMNLTRAYTLDHRSEGARGEVLSVGRVQTPTLAMLVERELAIRNFVPEDYLEVRARFDAGEGRVYVGTYFKVVHGKRQTRLPFDGEEAAAILERAKLGRTDIESIKKRRKRMPPPLLYDLTELQRHANRLYGFSAERTLGLAQTLYERYKAITYPRTDSRHLSAEIAGQLPRIARHAAAGYDPALIAEGTGERPLSNRCVDDSKVTDHHAIIPTGTPTGSVPDGAPEAKLLDLINRRLLQAWHGDYRYSSTEVITRIAYRVAADQYLSTGTAVDDEGWKVLDIKTARQKKAKGEPKLPGGLRQGQRVEVLKAEAVKKRTKPPPRFTEATLLTAMESAGKTLDSKQLSQAMKQRGIGTPATRASIIETLLKRKYTVRNKKQLRATDRGIRLLEVVHPKVRSAAMTGEWEFKLRGIERGDGSFDAFMSGIEDFVREVVGGGTAGRAPARQERPTPGSKARPGVAAQAVAVPSNDGAPTAARPRTRPPSSPPDAGAPHTPVRAGQAGPRRDSLPAAAQAPPADGGRGAGRTPGPQPSAAAPSRQHPNIARPAQQAGSALPSAGPRPATGDGPNGRPGLGRYARQVAPPPGTGRGSRDRTAAPAQPGRVPAARLAQLLRERFGHPTFRPHQEQICTEVAAGRDVLVVMPTGAGKSLCYQLPGVARRATTLVVSPLIALMEDQTEKLRQQGFRAERIHSGRDRLSSRQVCRDYLDGKLDFLYIAPERLGVPGFPELLARRTPGLVAIDEAHCISMWGHDFRPDYRRLRERVPALRPAPVIALTATATPRVQKDIVEQLGLQGCKESIHGFRRENLLIELVELAPSLRPPALLRLLRDGSRRPAIVYAPTRKAAEEQAEFLQQGLSAAAYHAGMLPEDRERIQAAFLQGRLEIIVATIAFGMGIDKPDVRTVVHTGLPGSIEGYYQEIGRAGRDGLPSKAILLHGWSDRKTHEFFLERDYPEPETLEALYRRLSDRPLPLQTLAGLARGDPQIVEKAIEKLWTYGGVRFDRDENAFRDSEDWHGPYVKQRNFRYSQLDRMMDFTRSQDCRMLELVRHFGDLEDTLKPCGQCDNCASGSCVVKTFRRPTPREIRVLDLALSSLEEHDRQSTGRLFKQHGEPEGMKRAGFERLIAAAQQAGLARIENDSFVNKDGKLIEFRRLCLTASGKQGAVPMQSLQIPSENAGLAPAKRKRARKVPAPRQAGRTGRRQGKQFGLGESPGGDGSVALVEAALRAWRKSEAQRRGLPAFRIFSNQVLSELAEYMPANRSELLAVRGIGNAIANNYGAKILEVIRRAAH